MFKLSRRKGSSLWQVRKRWPQDVAKILAGEFTRSTGEADKRKAQAMLPVIAAEYEAKIAQARARLADNRYRDLSEAEIRRMAAQFYRDALPSYRITKALSPDEHGALVRSTRESVEGLRKARSMRNFTAVASIAARMIEREGLPIPEESASRTALEEVLHRAFLELHQNALAQLEGIESYSPTDPVIASMFGPEAQQVRTVSNLIDEYKAAKWEGWSPSTRKAVEPALRVLRDILGDRPVTSVTREDARKLQQVIRELPRGLGRQKAFNGLTTVQAVEKGKALEMPVISPATVNQVYLVHVSAAFKWAVAEGWADRNVFTGLSVKDPVAARDKRDPFSADQLQELFSSGLWSAPAAPDRERPGRFWVPLVALWSGMRLGEISGLRVKDLMEIDGVLAFRVIPYEGRTLKNDESRRDLPVHSQLIRLGFAEFVAHRKKVAEPDALLFPDAKANVRGQFGAKLGEWFSSVVAGHGFEGTKLGMHSFRHNFEDRLRVARLHGTAQGRALAGRATGRGSEGDYGHGFPAREIVEELERIVYPELELSHLFPVSN